MAYLVYEADSNDTLESIAKSYGITSTELAKINNIRMPYNSLATLTPGTTLRVPELQNGRESYENGETHNEYMALRNFKSDSDWKFVDTISSATSGFYGNIGFASQNKCYMFINGAQAIFFPCYPDSYSDSHSANVSQQTPLGRSEPFQIYQNSGPRTVNVTFKMHREMTHVTPISEIVSAVQACCYPIGTSQTIIPRVTLVIGRNCLITGIIKNVSTDWSDTIIEQQYMMVSLGFSVEECTGVPRKFSDVYSARGIGYSNYNNQLGQVNTIVSDNLQWGYTTNTFNAGGGNT